MGRQLERHTNKNHHFGLQAFLIALVTACVLIIPFIIFDGGVFYYYGDFNVQEIPFYQMVHDAIKSGNLGWNTNYSLGFRFNFKLQLLSVGQSVLLADNSVSE